MKHLEVLEDMVEHKDLGDRGNWKLDIIRIIQETWKIRYFGFSCQFFSTKSSGSIQVRNKFDCQETNGLKCIKKTKKLHTYCIS